MREGFELHLLRVLSGPYETLESVLRAGPQEWLPGFTRQGQANTAEISVEQAGRRIRRRIVVTTGNVERYAYGVTVRIQWRAARHAELYPELEGHLRLERRQPAGCSLRLDARYSPPGGRLGASIDQAVLHKLAESSVGGFLDRVTGLLDHGGQAPRAIP
ncbi:MAG TPA: hypothetical protein VMU49_07870 [Candidatus Acidoferrales bacterium]|nr:hypothetical protein [Candidatus Acidoferrales bacterium]